MRCSKSHARPVSVPAQCLILILTHFLITCTGLIDPEWPSSAAGGLAKGTVPLYFCVDTVRIVIVIITQSFMSETTLSWVRYCEAKV